METEFPNVCGQIKSFVEALGYNNVKVSTDILPDGTHQHKVTAHAPVIIKEIKITARIEA